MVESIGSDVTNYHSKNNFKEAKDKAIERQEMWELVDDADGKLREVNKTLDTYLGEENNYPERLEKLGLIHIEKTSRGYSDEDSMTAKLTAKGKKLFQELSKQRGKE